MTKWLRLSNNSFVAGHVQRRGGGWVPSLKRLANGSNCLPCLSNHFPIRAYTSVIVTSRRLPCSFFISLFSSETCFGFQKIQPKQLPTQQPPPASACYLLPSREYPYASYTHKPLSSSDHSRTQWQPTSQLSHSRLGTLQQNQQTNQYSESTTPSQDQRMSLFPQTEGESTGTTVVLPSMTHPIWVMPGELVSLEYSCNG